MIRKLAHKNTQVKLAPLSDTMLSHILLMRIFIRDWIFSAYPNSFLSSNLFFFGGGGGEAGRGQGKEGGKQGAVQDQILVNQNKSKSMTGHSHFVHYHKAYSE